MDAEKPVPLPQDLVCELLAPAGGPAAFRAALAGGADAVYCGLGNDFNARRGADNFDDASFQKACQEAHVAGARVFVTMNVLVTDDEMPAALALAARAVRLGADALIIQDWGLAAEVGRRFPQAEVHVSTQANIQDPRGIQWCAAHGYERVTLSRELSLEEIAACCATGVECEVFGHGALCFCYSGLCSMSALRGSRSANRGLCAQPCRLPHELYSAQGKRLGPVAWERGLCPKDALSLDHLGELVLMGVGSLKVEGRMKAPDYVLAVVSAYRSALDHVARVRSRELDPEVRDSLFRQLKRAFNRDFTDGYLMGISDNSLMSYERSNNRGELVGHVVRAQGHEAAIYTQAPLGKGDLLELRPKDHPETFLTTNAPRDVEADSQVVCGVKRPVPAGTPVRLLRSQEAIVAAERLQSAPYSSKRPVSMHIICKLGQPLSIQLCALPRRDASAVAVSVQGPVVEAARTKAVTAQDLQEHAGRLGQSPFVAASITVDIDEGCGLGFSTVHRLRSQAADALEEAICAPYEKRVGEVAAPPSWRQWCEQVASWRQDAGLTAGKPGPKGEAALRQAAQEAQVCCVVSTPEGAQAALAAGATRLYAPADALAQGGFPQETIPWLDEVCRLKDHGRLDRWVVPEAPCAVGSMSEFALAQQRGAAPEIRPCIGVSNRSCVTALEEAGASGFWLSHELTVAQMAPVCAATSLPCGLVVYGQERAMTSEHCVLQMADACSGHCDTCGLRAQKLYLKNIDGRALPVTTDLQGRSRIYWDQPLDAVPKLRELLGAGLTRFMVDATLLDAEKTAASVSRLREALEAVATGGPLPAPEAGSVRGHLFSPVE